MLTEVAAVATGLGEATVSEAAVAEAVVAANELERIQDLMAILEGSTVTVPEVFTEFEAVAGPIKPHLGKSALERMLDAGAKSELTMEALEALEAAELTEEAELLEEFSQYDKLKDLTPEQIIPRAGRSPIPLARGSFSAQVARLSERAAAALQDAALRKNAEAALANDLAQAESMKKTAEVLEDFSHITDVAGDYLGVASYPEFMVRHSPGSK